MVNKEHQPSAKAARIQTAGYSLIEILVAMSILAVASIMVAPSIASVLEQRERDRVIHQFQSKLTMLRYDAVVTLMSKEIERGPAPHMLATEFSDWQVVIARGFEISPGGLCSSGAAYVHSPAGRRYSVSITPRTCAVVIDA